jgi:Uma2 family endonuclease
MRVEDSPHPAPSGGERRFILEDVPWWAYVALRDALEDTGTRMTYLEGRLELMSPSQTHEEEKTLIARLIEAYAEVMDLDLRGFGSTTFRREAAKRGLEADECYVVGPMVKGDTPQIALEVVVESPLLDKLDVYAGLGIREVWVWDSSLRAFAVHRLAGHRYERHDRSAILSDLDLALLASFVRPGENQTALVKAYRAGLGRRHG